MNTKDYLKGITGPFRRYYNAGTRGREFSNLSIYRHIEPALRTPLIVFATIDSDTRPDYAAVALDPKQLRDLIDQLEFFAAPKPKADPVMIEGSDLR